MPVMWHQTLLSFISNYKYYFTDEHKKKIKALIKVQNHHSITPEIRKEFTILGMKNKEQEVNMEMD